MATLVERAFGLKRYQFLPEPWMSASEYQLAARIPSGASAEDFAQMMQSLLKTRFGLTYRFEKRDTPGFALVRAKNWTKLKRTDSVNPGSTTPDGSPEMGRDGHPVLNHDGRIGIDGRIRMRKTHQSMNDLVQMLESDFSLPIVDATGVSEYFDINLFWVARRPQPPDSDGFVSRAEDSGPGFRDALEVQLGLKMEPTKVKSDVFVVEHLNRIPTAN